MPNTIKVFELESRIDKKQKTVTRRFIDRKAYNQQKDFFKHKNPQIGASHLFILDKWYVWTEGTYVESTDSFIIVKTKEELTQ
ncbi:MAG: hypothetical protein EOM47_01325 [Bacteroidia bacterium]|nr:hypothetical protein [Bacteroidia bacterium]